MKIKIIETEDVEGAATLTLSVVFSEIGACTCDGVLNWDICRHEKRTVKIDSFHKLKEALGEQDAKEVRDSIELWLDPPPGY